MATKSTDWRTAPLGEFVRFVSGGTPSREISRFWNGDIPWLSAKDMKRFRLSDSMEKITREGADNGSRLVDSGSVLILVRGMALLKDVPVGVTERVVAFNQDLKALIPNREVDGYYLGFYLAANRVRLLRLVNQASHGAGRLPSDLLRSFEIELPGIEEQRRIAEILLAWDAAVERAEMRVAAEIRLKRGLLEALFAERERLNGSGGRRWGSAAPAPPDHMVFRCDEGRLDPEFLDHFRRSRQWRRFVNSAGGAHGRGRFLELAALKVTPPLEEQRRIAAILNACDRELDLLRRQLAAIKRQKQGLMQKLLKREKR